MFLKLDESKDGLLSKEELQKGMAEILTFFNIDEEELNDMVRAIDTNNDGQIDYQEFITAAYDRQKSLSQKNLEAAFKAFDSDGNGVITMDELKAIFGRGQASNQDEQVW